MGSVSNASTKQLKDSISAVLDSKGVLSKIRAHLRASVLTSVENPEKIYGENESAKRIQSSSEVDLIREFLEFYEMEYTLSVFLHEANIAKASYGGRNGLAKQYNINPSAGNTLLQEVIGQKKPLSAPAAGSIPPSSSNITTAPQPAAQPATQAQPEKKEPSAPPPKKADLPGLSSKTSPELGRKVEPLKPLTKDTKSPAPLPTTTPAPSTKTTQPPPAAQPKKVEPPPVKKAEPPKAELTSLRGFPMPGFGKPNLADEDEEDDDWKKKESSLFQDDDDVDIDEELEIDAQYEDDFEDPGESDATEDRSADEIDVSGYEFSETIRK